MSGFISIHRKIMEHWIYQDPVKFKWWIDILLNTNYKDNKVNIGNQIFECKRGQSVRSLKSWSDRWGVSKDKARNFFELLKKDHMIDTENLAKTTRITVLNYDSYQIVLHADQTQPKRNPNATQTLSHPNNKENKENKENNKILFDDFWNLYGKKMGAKDKCQNKWNKLKIEEQKKILNILPNWKKQFSDIQYQPFPETFLNQKRWNDEFKVKSLKMPL